MLIPKEYIRKIVRTTSDLIIKSDEERLYFITTRGMETYIVDILMECEPINVCVDQKKFVEMGKSLEEVNIERKGKVLHLSDSNKKFTLGCKESIDLTNTDLPEVYFPTEDIPRNHLLSTVADSDIFGSISVKEGISIDNDYVSSTNGPSMTVVKSSIDIDSTVIVPNTIFKHINKQSNIGIQGNFVHIFREGFHCYGTSMYGDFPNVQALNDKIGYVNHFTVKSEELISLLTACSPLITDEIKSAKLIIEPKSLKLNIQDMETNSSFDSHITIESTASLECNINIETFIKVIQPFNQETIKIYFADNVTPFKIEGDNLTKFVVLMLS